MPALDLGSDPDAPLSSLLEEPMLPSRSTGTGPVTDTGQRRIEEIPKDTGSAPRSASASMPAKPDDGKPRKGLAESQLGKRLVRRVKDMYKQLEQIDYYQVLAVERTASTKQLRDAYFNLSTRVSPGPLLPAHVGEHQREDLRGVSAG